MADINKHTGAGRLGVEPKIINVEGGGKIGKLFAILNESYVDKAGKKHDDTLPVNIVLLKPSDVTLAETLHTGSPISWQGKLSRRTYEKDGAEQAVFEIVIAGPGSRLSVPEAKEAVGSRPAENNQVRTLAK